MSHFPRQDMTEMRQHMYEEHTELRNSIAQVGERLVRVEAAIADNPVELEGEQ